MARRFHKRIRVTGVLEAIDAIHIGSGADDVVTDLPLVEDGQGRYFIPGTSIAGALRQWCYERLVDPQRADVERLWGPLKAGENDPGAASWIVVDDAVLLTPRISDQHDISELRDHVGIDRQWGTAAAAIKFDRMVLPPGVRFQFQMTLTVPTAEDDSVLHDLAPQVLGHLVAALESQTAPLRLGGGKTRGLGCIVLKNEETRIECQSCSPAGLIDKLRGTLPDARGDIVNAAKSMALTPSHRVKISIHWKPLGPVMVKSGVDGLRVDAVPMLASRCSSSSSASVVSAPVIPGSSLKGALRSHAERIWRTLNDGELPPTKTGSFRSRFESQMTDANVDPVLQLFGRQTLGSDPKNSAAGWQAALSAADCYAERGGSRDLWSEMFYPPMAKPPVPEENLRKFNNLQARLGRPGYEQSTHVAIDRFTGGAAEGLLFSTLEPLGESWPAFELELDLKRLAKDRKSAKEQCGTDASLIVVPWMLLLFTLRDLVKGRLPIGFGGNRGFGEVTVEKIVIDRIEGDGLIDGFGDLPRQIIFPVTAGKLDVSACPAELLVDWKAKWANALNHQPA